MNNCLLVTGASSEVGIHFIRREGERFNHIVAHYCHESEALEQLKETYADRLRLVQADFTSVEGCMVLAEEIKREGLAPDCILHLPSAKYHAVKFQKMDWADYSKNIDIQLRSVVMLLQEFLPQMVKHRFGRIAFLLSSCTEGIAPKYLSDYVTTKYALLGLMRALASEYAGKGLTFNAVSPGMMETKLLSETPELIVRQNAMDNPYGRNVRIEDILPALSLLLSEEAVMITGQNLVITGGR